MTLSRRSVIGVMVALFVVAFAIRAYRPISRPANWMERSKNFSEQLLLHHWGGTFQRHHPGVTTMTAGGLTLEAYRAWVAGTPAEGLFTWAFPPTITDYGLQMTVSSMGLSVVLAALIVMITLALWKLADDWLLALVGGGLLVFEPYYLSLGRLVHVDALLASFMLLSAILLLVYLQTERTPYLVLSGLAGGLAVLTKTPSLFLVPFSGLALLVYFVMKVRRAWSSHSERRARWLVGEGWRRMVRPGLVLAVMAAVPFVFWPAMWVKPEVVLQEMFFNVAQRHFLIPHKLPIFFAGRIYDQERLSALFYPAMLVFNSSSVALVLSLVGIGHYTLWRGLVRQPVPPATFWLLVAYCFFYGLQMALGAKQAPGGRYLLPTHLMLDVVAAVGVAGLVDVARRAMPDHLTRLKGVLPLLAIAAVIGPLVAIALAYMPDYGAHHNYLLGGNRTAVTVVQIINQGEGFVEVGKFLSELPDPEAVTVGVGSQALTLAMRQHFAGENYFGPPYEADYYLIDIGTIQRERAVEVWEAYWEVYQDRPPQLVVTYDGVAFLWMHAIPPTEAVEPVIVRRGWVGFVWLAWLWTAGILAVLGWSLRRVSQGAAQRNIGQGVSVGVS